MTASTDNSYYDEQLNAIYFPAGILQPPNFDMVAGDAENYGNLASLIGHELTHGFDDEGPPLRRQGQSDRLVEQRGRRGL
jgi:predicted metalloendopeptidase